MPLCPETVAIRSRSSIATASPPSVPITKPAKYILEKTLVDRSYGARPLRRALQKYIEDPLSEALIQGTLPRPAELEVYLGDSGIYCRPIADVLQEQPVGAPSDEAVPSRPAGTPLYMF